jgi:hypothetical protein
MKNFKFTHINFTRIIAYGLLILFISTGKIDWYVGTVLLIGMLDITYYTPK